MSVRQKTSVRLDPEIVSLGRKLAKKDFGSEQKFGLLIENAIRAYHARQVQPVEASSLLSATEQALIDRIEKRVDEMGKNTVNRIGNLIAKSSYETAFSTIILEQLYGKQERNAKANLEQFRSIAAQRMQTRFDKENAERISSLLAENNELTKQLNALHKDFKSQQQQTAKNSDRADRLQNQVNDLKNRLDITLKQKADSEQWVRGLLQEIQDNSGFMKKSASKLLEEYDRDHPRPRGI